MADRLGVSIATVSRALRNSHEVGEELKTKIQALAKELNYRPNPFAQSLRKEAPRVIGVIVPNAPVSLKIVPFCHGKTECETAQIAVSVIKCTIETVKDGTVIISCCRHILARYVGGIVIGEELPYEICACTVAAPSLTGTIGGCWVGARDVCMHVAVVSGGHEEKRTCP